MLHEEKEFYQKVLKTLDDYRQGILENLFQGKLPHVPDQHKLDVVPQKKKEEVHPTLTSLTSAPSSPHSPTKIKFTMPMPSFVWKDMKQYGPFDIGEELEIYSEVADLIVRKGRAVKV